METYRKSADDILAELQTSENGLSRTEAQERLDKHGYNELEGKERDSVWKLFFMTFKDAMVIVLLVAAGIQLVLGEVVESVIIFLVLLLNGIISVVQTRKAESSLDALREMSAPSAKVVRDGASQSVPARELTKGDIVQMDAGDYVPADGRLIASESLKINEGMLTGESEAAEKNTETITDEAPIGDRFNMVHSGSLVVNGRGTFVVTGTANETEIGKIANLIATAEAKQTPLQRKLDEFSKKLGIGILLLCVLIFAAQALRIWFGNEPVDTTEGMLNAFMFAVAVAVAAIPEALSSIVTIVMAVGTTKMAKQQAIIRKLPAVETLGSTSVICTDKTGTLTQNKMTVTDTFIPGASTGIPETREERSESEQLLLRIAVLCNDSHVNDEGQEIGDPTETALLHFGKKMNEPHAELRGAFKRELELPFDSDRKLMSTVHTIDGNRLMLTKGGPDVMFNRCSAILINGQEQPMTDEQLNEVKEANEAFSSDALRVLAYGYKKLPDNQSAIREEEEHDLVLVGLTAMIDPPREAVYGSIEEAKSAGIRTIMITGDHKTTAKAIGKDIGLMDENDIALTGQELDRLSDEELDQKLEDISVYARVSPENKIRIVKAWQKKGHITAMTGDGVNDAPALKQADIGIAMGSGTDVAKDSAAMVLADDNFVSIVSAVGVGRTVFDNIKKAIGYLFAGNLGAIIAILFAVFFNLPNPFTALQLLFINLINDSLPALALGMEKEEPGVMKRKPRDINEGIFSGGTLKAVVTRGALIGIAVIISHYLGLQVSEEMGIAMAFTTLILARTLQTFAARSNTQTAFGAGFFSNKYVLGAIALCFLLYGVTVLPGVRKIFSIPSAFGMNEWFMATGLSIAAVVLMEIIKVIQNRK
ncbi:cation-translocating P-type ATPase [Domibacillus enclensis]|uniref:ATPase n=1 Tax=Domibacillus enclensis TaxID=1017273 RepID=A0A1N6ZYK0_9BACI|nr:cation-translocating P-type ATPase [Domibacillus enclensis]OXS75634.1 ATPase [Domibacillus enclensis]SIR31871.1 plasma-membrane calcium-translocating P-type ATPase [Domibacillus enclensis]